MFHGLESCARSAAQDGQPIASGDFEVRNIEILERGYHTISVLKQFAEKDIVGRH